MPRRAQPRFSLWGGVLSFILAPHSWVARGPHEWVGRVTHAWVYLVPHAWGSSLPMVIQRMSIPACSPSGDRGETSSVSRVGGVRRGQANEATYRWGFFGKCGGGEVRSKISDRPLKPREPRTLDSCPSEEG